jgi:hypothetical protein
MCQLSQSHEKCPTLTQVSQSLSASSGQTLPTKSQPAIASSVDGATASIMCYPHMLLDAARIVAQMSSKACTHCCSDILAVVCLAEARGKTRVPSSAESKRSAGSTPSSHREGTVGRAPRLSPILSSEQTTQLRMRRGATSPASPSAVRRVQEAEKVRLGLGSALANAWIDASLEATSSASIGRRHRRRVKHT